MAGRTNNSSAIGILSWKRLVSVLLCVCLCPLKADQNRQQRMRYQCWPVKIQSLNEQMPTHACANAALPLPKFLDATSTRSLAQNAVIPTEHVVCKKRR